MNAARIAELERELLDYERSAYDLRAWKHHREYDRKKATEMRAELQRLKEQRP